MRTGAHAKGKLQSQENGTARPTGPPAEAGRYEKGSTTGGARFSIAKTQDMDWEYVKKRLSLSEEETKSAYDGRSLTEDPKIYSYEFLTAQPDMKAVILPDLDSVRNAEVRIDAAKIVSEGLKNALSVGTERATKAYVENRYTGRELWVTVSAIRHGLNGSFNRLLTNARLGAVIGEIVQNAIPINALHNTADGVDGTYAMAGYAFDRQGREFVAIVTVEQRTNTVEGISAYDMTHAVSGRQNRGKSEGTAPYAIASVGGRQADTKSQGVNPIKASSEINIADLLESVKEVYQSILSENVLVHLGENRNLRGHYADRVRYSYAGENPKTQIWIRWPGQKK